MRLVVLSMAIMVVVSGCTGPSVSQLGSMPLLSASNERRPAPQSVAAKTLAAIAIARVSGKPPGQIILLELTGNAKRRSF